MSCPLVNQNFKIQVKTSERAVFWLRCLAISRLAYEILFDPYNAVDLRKILLIRIKKALKKKMLRKGVLEKIAAISSRTHGDARKAVELLSKSAELAEKEGIAVTMDVVDVALELVITQDDVVVLSIAIGYLEGDDDAAVVGDLGDQPVAIGQRIEVDLLAVRCLTEWAFFYF